MFRIVYTYFYLKFINCEFFNLKEMYKDEKDNLKEAVQDKRNLGDL